MSRLDGATVLHHSSRLRCRCVASPRPRRRLSHRVLAVLALNAGILPGWAETAHVLAEGETLYRVARIYDVPLAVLVELNDIDDPTTLATGTRLRIPDVYVVQPGDTLYSIARRHDVHMDQLAALNDIADPTSLRTGQALIMPARRAVAELVEAAAGGSSPDRVAPDTTVSISPAGGGTALQWPLDGPREEMTGKLAGVAISAPSGAVVRSVSAGIVRWAAPYGIYGTVVLVMSDHGYVFGYLGNDEALVEVGDRVGVGAELSRLATGVQSQLYFLVFKDGEPVDPGSVPRI